MVPCPLSALSLSPNQRRLQPFKHGVAACFLIFVGIYTNWSYYDQNFRFLRQRQASAFPWGILHGELWLRAQFPLARKPQPEHAAKALMRPNLSRVPVGFCFKYHRGLACSGCSFKHSCFRCPGDHRATM